MQLEISVVKKNPDGSWTATGETQKISVGYRSTFDLMREKLYVGPEGNKVALGTVFEYVSNRPLISSFELREDIPWRVDIDTEISLRTVFLTKDGKIVFNWKDENDIQVRRIP